MSSKFVRLAAGVVLFAATFSIALAAQSAPARLGLDEDEARLNLLHAINNGYFVIGTATAKIFKAAPPAVQKTLIDGMVAWAKSYTSSAEFKRAYAQARNDAKPDPLPAASDAATEAKRELEQQQKAVEDMKKAAASMPPDQRKMMEETIKQTMEAMKGMQNDPELKKAAAEMAQIGRQEDVERHTRDMAKWNEDYPENPNVLIARRLRQFLDVSADVDFNAKLERRGDKMKFVESRYEEKPAEWKMCYRAGRDAVAAARAVAQAWLKELR